MRSSLSYGGMAVMAVAIVIASARNANSAGQGPALVQLQASTPGVAQTGHLNITGTARAGTFSGSGAGLTGIPTSALTGTMLNAQLNANMLTTFGAQSVTGVKSFSATAAFTNTTPFTVLSNSTKVTNLNADLLDGFDSTDLFNASNFTSGTIADARLSTNVALLNNVQTFTGAKTFSTTPAFTAAGAPFTVTGTTKVTNLNADLFDGLNSTAFVTTGSTFNITANVAPPSSVISATNTGAGGTAIYGQATANDGYGIQGVATSSAGWAGVFTGGKGLYADNLNLGGAYADAPIAPLMFSTPPGEKIAFFGSQANNMGFGITTGSNSTTRQLTIHTDIANSAIRLNGGGAAGMILNMDTGTVGLGTGQPGATLDVNGTLRATALRFTDGAAANTVLLGDSGGNATWGKIQSVHLATDSAMLAKVTGATFFMGADGIEGNPGKGIRLSTNSNLRVVLDPGNGVQGGKLITYGPNGSQNVIIGNNDPNEGSVSVCDTNGTVQAQMHAFGDVGEIIADVKNFRVPDPEDNTKDIVYACVEGPEAAMYTRGTGHLVKGEAHIQLPDHFRKLAAAEGITVLLTPRSRQSRGIIYEDAGPSGFSVYELEGGKGTYTFDWEIKAVRKGHEDYEVIRPWDRNLQGDRAKQWTARLKSIEARKANRAARKLPSSVVAFTKGSIGGQK